MYTLKSIPAHQSNYGGNRTLDSIKYIVMHYTANDGDSAENNGKYYQNPLPDDKKASAHYFVDSETIVQSVPDNVIAWSVGRSKWNDCGTTGGGTLYGIATNANTLNIELCDDTKNGVISPSAKTIENALALVKEKMKQYGVPESNVIRHFDVNGKHCPAYWCANAENNSKWLIEFKNKLSETTSAPNTPSTSASPNKKTIEEIAKEVMAGKWGNGTEREQKLTAAGYSYKDVQAKVNELSGVKPSTVDTAATSNKVACAYRIRTLNLGWANPISGPKTAYNKNDAITDVAIEASAAGLSYQVHVLGGGWLPWVTGYNINDAKNGYAGNGKVIDAIRVKYTANGHKAKYRVATVNKDFWSYQYNDETTNKQDGYAGVFGKPIVRFELEII